MTARSMLNGMTPDQAVLEWLDAFEADLRREDIEAAAAKFLPDGHWRDLLAFTWHIETMNGTREIEGGWRAPWRRPNRADSTCPQIAPNRAW